MMTIPHRSIGAYARAVHRVFVGAYARAVQAHRVEQYQRLRRRARRPHSLAPLAPYASSVPGIA
eukprot:3941126-Rhodomonas_salina.1